ncbi:L-rhamnose mutarotase [Streptomyces sp. NPDC048231]|uniref:L-rhamnose mutarotase n=1 Tax=Streptomyces sp. NPDC048231 TaxID=3365519 RepID=UPI003723E47E
MQRFAAVIRLKPEKEEEYRRLHADCWPGVQAAGCRRRSFRYVYRGLVPIEVT